MERKKCLIPIAWYVRDKRRAGVARLVINLNHIDSPDTSNGSGSIVMFVK